MNGWCSESQISLKSWDFSWVSVLSDFSKTYSSWLMSIRFLIIEDEFLVALAHMACFLGSFPRQMLFSNFWFHSCHLYSYLCFSLLIFPLWIVCSFLMYSLSCYMIYLWLEHFIVNNQFNYIANIYCIINNKKEKYYITIKYEYCSKIGQI